MLTRILALVAVLLLVPSTLAPAHAYALSLESASLGIFAGNVDLLKEIPALTHCCIKEKSTEQSESSNRREEYLRARYMDPGQGRFLGMDPFGGNELEPSSLHKHEYAAANPTLYIDPSGKFFFIGTSFFGRAVEAEVEFQYAISHPMDLVEYGQGQWTGIGYLKPDIFNFTRQLFNEIKPLSPTGVIAGKAQLGLYSSLYGANGAFGAAGVPFSPDVLWTPGSATVIGTEVWFVNVVGLIFYTDDLSSARQLAAAATIANAEDVARRLKNSKTRVGPDAAVIAVVNNGIAAAAAYGTMRVLELVMRKAAFPRALGI